MKIVFYSHNLGLETLAKEMQNPLSKKLNQIEFKFRNKSASKLREKILDNLFELGWSDQIKVNKESRITITSMKSKVGLCLQLGNMARFYADLLKLELLHQQKTITSAIYIIPTKQGAVKLGSNIASFERFVEELKLFQNIITIPIAVIGIEEEEI